jgi:type VI secretion system protein ImpA
MASPPVLENLDALLEPIPGDDPAGQGVPFQVNENLEQFRKEVNPDDFDESDPRRPDTFVPANWEGIKELAIETLTDTSKDLKVAARLLEALLKVHGFAGLRDGLTLLRRLVEEAWDRLRPVIETDDDLEIRAAPFFWLDDPMRGPLLPNSIRTAPLILAEGDPYSFARWNKTPSKETRDKAIAACSYQTCKESADDLTAAVEETQKLIKALHDRMGPQAPGLQQFYAALIECQSLARMVLKEKGPPPEELAAEGGEEGGEAPAGEGRPRQAVTRDQILQTIAQAASQLRTIEPHSPVPYLLEKAVELGRLPFPELMKALVRNNDVLASLAQELGIHSLAESGESE